MELNDPRQKNYIKAPAERIYYVKGLRDSHNAFYEGKYTIAQDGYYLYQIENMPPAQAYFTAGNAIPYPLMFIFNVSTGVLS